MLCRKLTDTPVPFPWVQAINITLLIFAVLVPFAIASFVHSMFAAVIMTFVVVSTYVTLNEVASDIEDPFHYDPNELPLPQVLTPLTSVKSDRCADTRNQRTRRPDSQAVPV